MTNVEIITSDAFSALSNMPSEHAHCCVTSPPYWGLRDYGVMGQMGLEDSVDEYVAKMVAVFREVRRVLRGDGTLWLNLGDSYAGSWGNQSRPENRGKQRVITKEQLQDFKPYGDLSQKSKTGSLSKTPGLKPKDLIGVPWRVAFALQADGWYLRQDIIWHKPNPMPESVRDRCTKAHEYIFLMSKSPKYYFDHEAMQEDAICGARGSQFHTGKTGEHQLGRAQKVRPSVPKGEFKAKGEPLPGQLPSRAVRETRNRRTVWSVTTKPFKGAHFATFPQDLIEPCILAGCPEGGTVLDPFFGAGTTGLVARKYWRNCIGIELNPAYVKIAEERLSK